MTLDVGTAIVPQAPQAVRHRPEGAIRAMQAIPIAISKLERDPAEERFAHAPRPDELRRLGSGRSGARILVVDEEPQILHALRTSLQAAGFEVDAVGTPKDALAVAALRPPDAVILELALPCRNGTEIIRELLAASAAPLIVVSAVTEEWAKVAALDAGADDYVTKPFGIAELLARVRAVLRRTGSPGKPVIELGELVVDLENRIVSVRGESVHLTPLEFRVLRVLALSPGKLLTPRTLLQQVWGAGYGRESYLLYHYVSRIRHKIERDPARPRHLLTLHGAGYRLISASEELPRRLHAVLEPAVGTNLDVAREGA
jgi:two-component system KDP operon response regulator KdpE